MNRAHSEQENGDRHLWFPVARRERLKERRPAKGDVNELEDQFGLY